MPRNITNATLPLPGKIADNLPFPKKSYSRFMEATPVSYKGQYLVGVYTASTANDASELPAGFRPISPSVDTVHLYVDSVNGSDSNTGLSSASPKKSWTAVVALARSGQPDWIHVKRGSVFTGTSFNIVPTGKSAEEPLVVTFYGTSGERPRFDSAATASIFGTKRHIRYYGLEFKAYKLDPFSEHFHTDRMDYRGLERYKSNINVYGNHQYIHWIDCVFNFCELIIQTPGESAPFQSGPYFMHRCIFKGVYTSTSSFHFSARPSGAYFDRLDGYEISECTYDKCGWNPIVAGAGANMYNHDIYSQYYNTDKCVIKDSLLLNPSAHGLQFRQGGGVFNCFFYRCSVSLTLGNHYGGRAWAYNNVIHQGRTMRQGNANCIGTNTCTPAIWGLDIAKMNAEGDPAGYQIHGNIVTMLCPIEKDPTQSTGVKSAMRIGNPDFIPHTATQNHFYKWNTTTQGTDQGYPSPERTLKTYLATLGFASAEEEDFVETVINRPLGAWSDAWSAKGVNPYFRTGFGQAEVSYTWL